MKRQKMQTRKNSQQIKALCKCSKGHEQGKKKLMKDNYK